MDAPLIASLRRAILAEPDDVPLRLALVDQLLAADRPSEAIAEIGAILQREPTNSSAYELMNRALKGSKPATSDTTNESDLVQTPSGSRENHYDWQAAEAEVDDIVAPMFVEGSASSHPYQAEQTGLTLADVGGLDSIKEQLHAAFLAPLRNPELRRLYAKSLKGGLLLYGPPGCGKTFLARAVAGELGAKFISVGLPDVLDPYIGNSERNLHELFQAARRQAPCVLFLDEVDALGMRRTQTRNSAIRGAVNQLLVELDGFDSTDADVFVLAATNQPWDIDPALRRPGRLDRTLLVLPPDEPARRAIFGYHLKNRPVAGIDLARLAAHSRGLSGADIAFVCERASELALMESSRSGAVRMIEMQDLNAALNQVRPSIGPWLESARSFVLFGHDDGTYDDLRAYLKRTKHL